MDFTRQGKDVFVRLDPGEEIHESLRRSHWVGVGGSPVWRKMTAAAITSGIGRVRDVEIGYLDAEGVYQTVVHKGAMELLSMEGNLAPGPNEMPHTHIHVVLSDDSHVVHGGHLVRATVAVTAEIHLRDLTGVIHTAENPAVGTERVDGAPFEREENWEVSGSEFLRLSFCGLGDSE